MSDVVEDYKRQYLAEPARRPDADLVHSFTRSDAREAIAWLKEYEDAQELAVSAADIGASLMREYGVKSTGELPPDATFELQSALARWLWALAEAGVTFEDGREAYVGPDEAKERLPADSLEFATSLLAVS